MPKKDKNKNKHNSSNNVAATEGAKVNLTEKASIQDQVGAIAEAVARQGDILANITANKAASSKAIDHPLIINPTYETEENETGEWEPRGISNDGPATESIAPARFKGVNKDGVPYSKDKLAHLAFMEEVLTVNMHESTDDNALENPCVINDGVRQWFVRGQEQQVKRKFVEVLCRCKKTTYKQKMVDYNGDKKYVMMPHTALEYPFTVTHDPRGSTKGSVGYRWLTHIQAEA